VAQGEQVMSQVFYTVEESPVGTLLLAWDERGLRFVSFAQSRRAETPRAEWRENRAPFVELIRQLKAYFRGELRNYVIRWSLLGFGGEWAAKRQAA